MTPKTQTLSTISVFQSDIDFFKTYLRRKQSELDRDLSSPQAFNLLINEFENLKNLQTTNAA